MNEIIDNVSPNLSFIDVDVNHVDEDDDEKWKRAFVENMEKCINLFCIWDCAWIWIRIRDIYCIKLFWPNLMILWEVGSVTRFLDTKVAQFHQNGPKVDTLGHFG